MDPVNWVIISKAQAATLIKDETDLLDRVQVRLALTDREFLDFLILLGNVSAPGVTAFLGNVKLQP